MPYGYDALYREACASGVDIIEKHMRGRNRGLYGDGLIVLDKRIPTRIEKACILAEELGHYHTSAGDITDQTKIPNRKQERRAREWAHNKLIPLQRIIEAHHAKITGRHELAEYLGVTEEFLDEAINRYKDKYGLYANVDDRYTVMFDPLSVIEIFDMNNN